MPDSMIVVETSTSRVAAQERVHLLLQLALPHLPVRDDEAELRAELPQLLGRLLDRLDPVVQVERLPAALDLALERRPDELLVVLADGRPDRAPALRRRLDDRDVPQAGERHVQRARDRRRGEREHVHLEPERAEQLLLRDAEALLLVEDHEPEILRDHVAAEDAVRADQHLDLALGEVLQDLLRLGRLAEARDHLDADGEVAVARLERVPVLLGEDRRRAEDERLLAVDRGGERGAHGDLGLAEADVAADEPVHRPRRLEVLLDRLDRARLVLGLAVGELRLEPLQPLVPEVVRRARRLLALRVERDQLGRELAHRLAGARLQVLPRLAAELGERRRAGVGADVLRDLAELLVRDVEAVLAAEREEEVVARDARDLLRLEAEQLADAVVLVDDEVAAAEVGERGERAAEPPVGARRPLAEDLRVRQQHEAELAPDEAAAGGRDREEELRLLRAGPAPASSTRASARLSRFSVRSASPACGNATTTRLPPRTKPFSSVLGLGEPARGDRGPLRLEGERLRLRERVELGRARERDLGRGPPRPRRAAPRPAARRSPARGRARGRGRPGSPARSAPSSSSASVGSLRSAFRSAAG